jgi:solute carrier family 25 (mitochondrial carnitine/acylcarnitine transporter), member 20/29
MPFLYSVKVQGQGGAGPQYKGVFDVIGHLYKEGGVRSIYRGTFATLARDGPGSAACVSLMGYWCLSS